MKRHLVALGFVLALFAPACGLAGSMSLLGAGKPPNGGGGGGSPPAYAWQNSGDIATSSTSTTTSKGANSISTGDLLIILVELDDNSVTNHSVACPSGFTAPSGFPNYDSGGNSGINSALCWKIAGGSETGSYSPTWSTGNSIGGLWSLIDFTGANATTPIEAAGAQNNGSVSNSTSTVTPTVTAGGANRLWVSCSLAFRSGQTYTGIPSGMTQIFNSTTGTPAHISCATKTVGSGATGTATWTLGSGSASGGISFLLQP